MLVSDAKNSSIREKSRIFADKIFSLFSDPSVEFSGDGIPAEKKQELCLERLFELCLLITSIDHACDVPRA